MNLADFQSLRDANWGNTCPASPSTPLRDPVCDRNIFDAILAELFASEKEELTANSGNTIMSGTVPIAATNYQLYFKKIGNEVIVQGYFNNVSGATISANTTIFSLSNTGYRLKSGSFGVIKGVKPSGADCSMYLVAGSNAFKTAGAIATGTSTFYCGRYTCVD